MFGTMMPGRFVGVMTLHPLMSRPHRDERTFRGRRLAENAGQDRKHQ